MKGKLILTIATGLLAGTVVASAQLLDGGPSNERDASGATTDSSQNSAYPGFTQQPSGMGRGSAMIEGGTVGYGAYAQDRTYGYGGAWTRDNTPLQPGGISPSQPPQGRHTGAAANPNPR
jgi:hypothetical protein